MIDIAKLNRANNLLERALDEVNEHESAIAAAKLLSGLMQAGIRRGDVMFIMPDTPEHTQLLAFRAEYRRLWDNFEELQSRYLSVLVNGSAPEAKPKATRTVTCLPVPAKQEHAEKPKDTPKKPASKALLPLTTLVKEILVGLQTLGECTVRQLSFHLYGKPDTNTVLDDRMKTLMSRKWVKRRTIPKKREGGYGNSKYLYSLTDAGLAIAEKIEA